MQLFAWLFSFVSLSGCHDPGFLCFLFYFEIVPGPSLSVLFLPHSTGTPMAEAAMQGAGQHIGSSLGFSNLPKDTFICRPGEPAASPEQYAGSTLEPQPFSCLSQLFCVCPCCLPCVVRIWVIDLFPPVTVTQSSSVICHVAGLQAVWLTKKRPPSWMRWGTSMQKSCSTFFVK